MTNFMPCSDAQHVHVKMQTQEMISRIWDIKDDVGEMKVFKVLTLKLVELSTKYLIIPILFV